MAFFILKGKNLDLYSCIIRRLNLKRHDSYDLPTSFELGITIGLLLFYHRLEFRLIR